MAMSLYKEMGDTHFVHNGLRAKLTEVLNKARETNEEVDFDGMRFTPMCSNILSSLYVGEDGNPAFKIKAGSMHPTIYKYLNENCARYRNKLEEGNCTVLEFKATYEETEDYIDTVPEGTKFVINESTSRNNEMFAYMGLFTCLRPDVDIYMGAIASDFIKFMHGLFRNEVSESGSYMCVKDENVLVVQVDPSTNTVDMDKYGKVEFDEFRHRFFAVPAEVGSVMCEEAWIPYIKAMFKIVSRKYQQINARRSLYDFLDKGDS